MKSNNEYLDFVKFDVAASQANKRNLNQSIMSFKCFLGICFLQFLSVLSYAQDSSRLIHSVTIGKYINENGRETVKFFLIDSSGNISNRKNKIGKYVDIANFAKEINKYVYQEKITKHPGSDNIIVIGAPIPKLNSHNILISIEFLDDHHQETSLRNKTYYSWGASFSNDYKDYTFYKYLNQDEVDILRRLLD